MKSYLNNGLAAIFSIQAIMGTAFAQELSVREELIADRIELIEAFECIAHRAGNMAEQKFSSYDPSIMDNIEVMDEYDARQLNSLGVSAYTSIHDGDLYSEDVWPESDTELTDAHVNLFMDRFEIKVVKSLIVRTSQYLNDSKATKSALIHAKDTDSFRVLQDKVQMQALQFRYDYNDFVLNAAPYIGMDYDQVVEDCNPD